MFLRPRNVRYMHWEFIRRSFFSTFKLCKSGTKYQLQWVRRMLEQQQNMVKAIEFPPCLTSALAPRDRSQLINSYSGEQVRNSSRGKKSWQRKFFVRKRMLSSQRKFWEFTGLKYKIFIIFWVIVLFVSQKKIFPEWRSNRWLDLWNKDIFKMKDGNICNWNCL